MEPQAPLQPPWIGSGSLAAFPFLIEGAAKRPWGDASRTALASGPVGDSSGASAPVLRAVLLGASNLRMGFPSVLPRLRAGAGGPVEVLAALGHGRSYGSWSRLLWVRQLPGISGCGLWADLDRRPPLSTLGLITDVGNDLLYGAPAAEIAAWVEACLERLRERDVETILTLLPLATLEKVSAFRYHLVRTILFPGRRAASWDAMLYSVRELNESLCRLGRAHGARLVEPSPSWYGIDPIHVRRRMRETAWSQILRHRLLPHEGSPARLRALRSPLPALGAAEQRLCGVPLRTPQPARRFKDGTTVALY